MDRLRASVVIPVFNEIETIRACLDGLAGQSVAPHEVIIVDNNSTDDTMSVVDEYRDRLPIVVRSEPRQGCVWARQAGYDAIQGDIICGIDADTVVEPRWVEVAVTYLQRNEGIGGIGGPAFSRDAPSADRIRRRLHTAAADVGFGDAGPIGGLTGNNTVLRRSAWEAIRHRVKNLPKTHEDVDLSYAIGKAGIDIRLVPALIVGASTRRYEASPRSNLSYLAATVRTQRAHGDNRAALLQALLLPLNLAQMTAAGAVYRAYDAETRQWRLAGMRGARRASPLSE